MPQPAIAMPDALAEHFRGEFEIHVTVESQPDEYPSLEAWADARGAKFTHIVLARGAMSSQPMLTARATGTLGYVASRTAVLVHDLLERGFTVVRAKIEAAPDTVGVPMTTTDATALPDGLYFEHHLKLVLDPDFDETALTAAVIPHGAHLSRNARRVRGDRRIERFVTQRCRRVGRVEAGERLDRLTASLDSAGLHIQSLEREFVVYDSSPAVDAGWIDEDASTP